MTSEDQEQIFKLELEEDGVSVMTESDNLNSPQVDGNTEMYESDEDTDSSCSNVQKSSQSLKYKRKSDGYAKKRRKKRKGFSQTVQAAPKPKSSYKCTNFLKEDHKQPIFGIQFFQLFSEDDKDPLVFIYKCEESSGRIALLQNYCDSDPEENFYTCSWSYNSDTMDPVLAFAGSKGIIHVVSAIQRQTGKFYQSHGSSINEIRFHPVEPSLLFSASKDHSIRLWNTKTDVCIALFGGVDGHRDEVLSIDFDILGTKMVSCGMDHSLKIWSLKTDKLTQSIEASFKYDNSSESRTFKSLSVHYPAFSTRDVHRNYVDCVRWYGDLILSKSCDNKVVLWRPKLPLGKLFQKKHSTEGGVSILHKFEFCQCDIWFIKFALDYNQKFLAVGNQTGKISMWDLDVDQPSNAKQVYVVVVVVVVVVASVMMVLFGDGISKQIVCAENLEPILNFIGTSDPNVIDFIQVWTAAFKAYMMQTLFSFEPYDYKWKLLEESGDELGSPKYFGHFEPIFNFV
eukprot:gene156-768_t